MAIETFSSPVNGKITVELVRGSYRVSVKKYWQSGIYPENVIKTGLKGLTGKSDEIKEILILGIGCGSMAKVINYYFPKAFITGVDIDPMMVDIGKKYFKTGKIKNLEIVISDACQFIHKINNNKKYNLIVSDLFIGCQSPNYITTDKYSRMIHTILKPQGIYVCNCSYNSNYKDQTEKLILILKKIFKNINTIKKYPNYLIQAYK